MKQKIIEFLQKFQEKIFQKRKLIIATLPIILTIATLYPAKAYALGPVVAFVLGTAIASVAVPIITGLTTALTFVSLMGGLLWFSWVAGHWFMLLAIKILNWAIKGGPFAFWSMTNPANNQIISIGWTLLRDLTNMFFILGLAYIGLATALNFASFNTKKTFTTLIIIALLINFTPVICGLIIDGANIISNFFLSEINFDSMADVYTNAANQESGPVTKENLSSFQYMAKFFIMQTYSFFAGCVLLTFGCIFLLRTFIIWFLVILSPLAFFCRIFSFSEQWFKKWWSLFVGWSFVAIPAAFFLYLANHLLVLTKSGTIITWSSKGNLLSTIFSFIFPTAFAANAAGTTADLGFWGNLTPYIVATAFLIVGLITTLKIKTAGTGFIMNIANKAARLPGTISSKAGATVGKMVGDLAGAAIGAKGLKGQKYRLGSKEGSEWAKEHPWASAPRKVFRFLGGSKKQYTQEEIGAGKHKKWYRTAARAALAIPTAGATLWGGKALTAASYQAAAALKKQQGELGKGAVSKDASLEEKRAARQRMGLMNSAKRMQTFYNILESGDASDVWDLDNDTDRKQVLGILEEMMTKNPDSLKKARLVDFMEKYEEVKDANGNVIMEEKKDAAGNIMNDTEGKPIMTPKLKLKRESLLKQAFDNNKDKVSADYLDRAGLKISESDMSTYNTNLPPELEITNDPWKIIKRKMIASTKANDIAFMSKGDLEAMMRSPEFHRFGNQAQISKAAEIFAREAVEKLQSAIDENRAYNPNYYQEYNKRLHNYFNNSPAKTLGISYEFQDKKGKAEKEKAEQQLEDLKKEKDKVVEELNKTEKVTRFKKWESLENQREDFEQQIKDLEKKMAQEKAGTAELDKEATKRQQKQAAEQEKIKKAQEAFKQQKATPTSQQQRTKKQGGGGTGTTSQY